MKKFTSLIILGLMSFTSLSALEPLKVAIMNNSSSAVSVQVKLNDYTGGTATTKYTGALQSLTPNGSGIIIVQVANNVGTDWDDITATEVNSYYVLDVLVGGTLYAQYRLDQLILSQSQSTLYNNEGNLTPTKSGDNNLGEDNSRWGELYVRGNTIHIGPDGGMAGTDELAFSYNDVTNTATVTVAGANELLVNSDGIVINGGITANPTGADKDFIFGDDDFTYTGPGQEYKMFYDRGNGSFRVGNIDGNHWDTRGSSSFAAGFNTRATGSASTAMGVSTTASGVISTAMGYNTISNQSYSTAMGHSTTASGIYSTAMGNQSVSSNIASTSMGFQTTASGNSSTAMGVSTEASGDYSTAMGYRTLANESGSVAMGMYNDYTITGELLTIGNGTGYSALTNAFEVYKNGNVVIGDDANATHTVRGIMNMNQGINANGSSSSVAVHFSATAPSSPLTGSLWYDTGASALKIWNGGAWVNI
ncbi:MAG: hypothetical protein CVV25_02755 [Ignavibacteriae bacterium HGW-Ignavibacteriae-4]|jgi:hypothetical protein|nr:MAG: hypothetical protein CVV25_02755 [Ignavibacteriae bacterium HGW-Ignavibacteriae-4]